MVSANKKSDDIEAAENTSLMGDQAGKDGSIENSFATTSYTLNIETFRAMGLAGTIFFLLVCKFFTDNYADVDPNETIIFQLFGFNHICYYIDYYPANIVGAILVPLNIIPMVLFVVGSYFRTRHAYQSGKVPKWLADYNNIATVFSFFANFYVYIVFVIPPYEEHLGFIGHYFPYLLWKISQGLLAIEQVYFMIYTKARLPCGVPHSVAKGYVLFFVALNVVYCVSAFTVGIGHPILLDPGNNPTHVILFEILARVYDFLSVAAQLIFAIMESRNGNLSTIHISNVYE